MLAGWRGPVGAGDYPVQTGPGELTESGLYRRRSIALPPVNQPVDGEARVCDQPDD
ncbi:MAG: hypothetical protein ACI91F_002852 [Candidatus Binatia bacterium]|jgi:hypothetical protein